MLLIKAGHEENWTREVVGYRLFDNNAKTVFVSRTVKFLVNVEELNSIDFLNINETEVIPKNAEPRRNPNRTVKDTWPIPNMALKEERRINKLKLSVPEPVECAQDELHEQPPNDGNDGEGAPEDPDSLEEARESKWWSKW